MIGRTGVPSLLVLAAVAGASCSKEKQSLVLVELDFAAPPTSLMSLTLAATPGPTRMYDLSTLSANGAVFGLYVPGDLTGSVKVDATAYPQDGSCAGYKGSDPVSVAASGVTTQVVITMDAADVCTSSGTGGTGAAGTSGAAGMTGSAGTGGSAGTAGTGGSAAGTSGTAGTGGNAGTTRSARRGGTSGGGWDHR